jgi:hypothetical protein
MTWDKDKGKINPIVEEQQRWMRTPLKTMHQ